MLTIIIAFFTVLIFPIFLNIYAIVDYNEKKLYINCVFFDLIKIIGGYVNIVKEGILFHYSNKKAFLINYKSFFNMHNNVKPFLDYHFLSINTLTEIKTINLMNVAKYSFLIEYLNWFLGRHLSIKKPQLNYINSIRIYQENGKSYSYIKTDTVLNLLMVFISIIKMFMEKLFNEHKKRK